MENNKLYSPCFECLNRYGHSYTEDCDNKCEYANILSKLKPYGEVDDIVRCMRGEAIPINLLKGETLDWTFHIVSTCKKMREEQSKESKS